GHANAASGFCAVSVPAGVHAHVPVTLTVPPATLFSVTGVPLASEAQSGGSLNTRTIGLLRSTPVAPLAGDEPTRLKAGGSATAKEKVTASASCPPAVVARTDSTTGTLPCAPPLATTWMRLDQSNGKRSPSAA